MSLLDDKFFLRFRDDEEGSSMSVGHIEGFVSANFLLVRYYDLQHERLALQRTIIGIPQFEECYVFDTLGEALNEFHSLCTCDPNNGEEDQDAT